ncbi:MAG TPA: hypothetical protein VLT58_15755 [Polyangia bacterium]|nr:hypothetical protein [Polyangia bacterium]
MGLRSAVGLMVLAAGVAAGSGARAETRRADRPDGGAPLLESPSRATAAESPEPAPATPPPRALDSKRTPMPDREALPQDLQDAPLAPPTPPIPQNTTGAKKGGGPSRVKEIFHGQPGAAGGQQQPRDNVTRTPEDQLAPAPPAR